MSFPGDFGHGTKEAYCTVRRLDLGQLSRDLAIKHELLELGEGQVAKAVMPAHELDLVVNGNEVDVLVFLELGIQVKGEWPHHAPSLLSASLPCFPSLTRDCLLVPQR